VTKESDPTDAVLIGDLTTTPTPTITGTPTIGESLTAVTGTWDSGVALTYQWTAGGTDVAGATSSTYAPVPADIGKMITVKVTGTKTGYAPATKESAPTGAVAAGTLSSTSTPTISGTAKYGETLMAVAGTWDAGTTFTYQWLVGGNPVAGATSLGYVLQVGDVGKAVTVAVTGTKPGYTTVTWTSAATAAVQAASLADSACTVAVSGKAKVGKKLAATVGSCPAGATVIYAWIAGGDQIDGATGSRYKIKKAQAGKKIKVRVTVSVPGYTTVTRTSDPTGKVKKGK
jgi:hypothetical protein